jgi:hypothetical protein
MQIKMGDANIPATTTFVHQPFEGGTQRNNFATMLMWQRPEESPQKQRSAEKVNHAA